MGRLLRRNKDNFNNILKKYFVFKNETKSLEPLKDIFNSIVHEDFEVFLAYLKNNPEICDNFGYYIRNLFDGKPFNLSLTEADILSENAFYPELKKRILNKILPSVDNENSVSYLVDTVSVHTKKDLAYLKNISDSEMDELFRLLKIDDFIRNPKVKNELMFSMNILAWRVIGNALDVDVVRMAPEYKNFDNPFLALQNELDLLLEEFKKDPAIELNSKSEIYKQMKVYLQQCQEFVNLAFKNASKYGISNKINQSLLKIRQQLERVSIILNLLVIDSPDDYLKKSRQLFFSILDFKSHKNNISDLVSDSTRLISHLITTHTSEVGTHYITTGRKDYFKMLLKSSGGGVIVGALCVLKMLYSYSHSSDFVHAFMYSFNYAMGFVMIYLMNFTLATKQPAMTAATMARVLSEGRNTKKNYIDFAHLVSKLFRSQFIAFVGNVLLSFPVALIIIYGLEIIFKQNLAIDKSSKLLQDLDPIHSKAIFHACIAGFFLFISGIIAGNVSNTGVFYQIPKRIAKNPFINYFFGEKFARNLSVYYSRNWGGIVSNFWFGIFLGATAPIGLFLGLDLDIRHITFAAGNFALGLYGKDFNVTTYAFWISFVTVFLIGFFNFLVSFGLSMVLAFRSRKVNMGEVRLIIAEIFRYFFRNPLRFFLPIRSRLDERAMDLMKSTNTTKTEGH
ncbi:site-specific recombinase [Elizabethkingia ursingii]|uniref:site-specific recombinase n=1 Tax=Elizabethkingia ursingii TaxID=1756150 RepID=UPI002011BD9C|nr:site-specific recombinase [Elizabethkingia ursingii]MCL1668532.1 site-specific recombinase [Elizabethkingia ursingii]